MWPRLLAILTVLAIAAPHAAEATVDHPTLWRSEWLAYAGRFVTPDGRVVDTSNGGISHSEGQGYAMLLAVAFDDRPRFERLWAWTRRELGVREDGLFAWRWEPEENPGEEQAETTGRVTDSNNASDGDILIAWALLRAAERWDDPAHRDAAISLLQAIREHVIVESDHGLLLLPGVFGFEREESLVVNLSYWVHPAFRAFADVEDTPVWDELIASGVALVDAARFGEHELPPDWLEVMREPGEGAALRPAEEFPPRFSFDAIRIPLYAYWGAVPGFSDPDGPFGALRSFWAQFDGRPMIPATVDLETGAYAEYGLSQGGRATVVVTRFAAVTPDHAPYMLPRIGPEDSYYSATLILLNKLAIRERIGT